MEYINKSSSPNPDSLWIHLCNRLSYGIFFAKKATDDQFSGHSYEYEMFDDTIIMRVKLPNDGGAFVFRLVYNGKETFLGDDMFYKDESYLVFEEYVESVIESGLLDLSSLQKKS